MNLIFPVMFLALLNLFVFLLPQDSGERVGFSVTLLLANVMFLTIAENMLPATAIPRTSAICIALLLNLCYSGLIVVTVIISGNIYHKSDEEVISNWIVKFVQIDKLFRSNHKQVSSELELDGEKSEKQKENNVNKVNWQQVARMLDRIALISYIILFIFGCIGVVIDVFQR